MTGPDARERHPDLGGIGRAVGWRQPVVSRLDDLGAWMGYLAAAGVRQGREAVRAAELLAAGQTLAAAERGRP